MFDFDLSDALTALFVAVIGGAGFLIRRTVTGARQRERMDVFAGAADIVAKMKQHNLTREEVQEMQVYLTGR